MLKKEFCSYLSMGSNIGNKLGYLLSGIFKIDQTDGIVVEKVSNFYETPPWGFIAQDTFYNIAVKIRTTLLPYELLKELQRIELELNRTREVRWGPRTLDIDIIFYDNLEFRSDDLNIPHIMYKERKFVLKPLYDVYHKKSELLKYLDGKTDKIEKVRPKVLVSSCLLGEECTYRGDSNKKDILDTLNLEYIEVCPEVLGGLSTPRPPVERQGKKVADKDGTDVTKEFILGAEKTLETAKNEKVELAILKSKSPSCGNGKIYDGTFTSKLIDGKGMTSELLENNGIDVIVL